MTSIFKNARSHFQQQLPFVLYCKPNSTDLIAFFQKNKQLNLVNDFSEKGFVFTDFKGSQSIVFPESECVILTEKIDLNTELLDGKLMEISENGKEQFQNLVQNGIQAIQNGIFEKVVLSRKETVEIKTFSFLDAFKKMLSNYSAAFRYCWFHPEIGMWMGATPEQLLKIEASKFKTVALAGTQKWQSEVEAIWEEKEKQEQQFVTDFIVSSLETEVKSLNISKPYTFQAGNLVHLKTDVNGVFKATFNLKKVIHVLHPTPAVCGLPKEVSKDFILANEGYDRKFYAGYLGELNKNVVANQEKDSDLFVNLRCMEIEHNRVHLYIGCGITKDSNPEKEYIETANKALTMKQILN